MKAEASRRYTASSPAQYRVRVASAEGALAKARAAQMNARDQERRAQQLRDSAHHLPCRSGKTGHHLMPSASMDVTIAEAALAEAKLNLDYTEVTAPISGVIGRALVTEGALVSAQTEVLATIQQLDPVYVDFTQSSSALLKLRRALAAGELVATAPNEAQMRLLGADDGLEYINEVAGPTVFRGRRWMR
ncbi:MAG: hypothetical protein U5N10_10315 [Gemmobacter sp.]|nr:hypothetical protein [Gemmobacter sp.]